MKPSKSDDLEAEYEVVNRQFVGLGTATAIVLLGGTIFYHLTEHFSWLNSIFFCVTTLTTVGYGNIVPVTAAGKIFTIFYILVGIGIIATFANTLIHRAMLKRQRRNPRR